MITLGSTRRTRSMLPTNDLRQRELNEPTGGRSAGSTPGRGANLGPKRESWSRSSDRSLPARSGSGEGTQRGREVPVMKVAALLTSFVLANLLWSGCAGPSTLGSISLADRAAPLRLAGFSVLPPQGEQWVIQGFDIGG